MEVPRLNQQFGKEIFDRWAIDLVTMPQLADGPHYLVCCIDYASRWSEVGILFNKTADTVSQWFLEHIICQFGPPSSVMADNGKEFEAEFSDLLRNYGITRQRNKPYHPQSNGLIERFNRTIQDMIFKLALEHSVLWSHIVPYAAHAYRCAYQESIGCSPFEYVYGIQPKLSKRDETVPEGSLNEEKNQQNIEERREILQRKREIAHLQERIAKRH